MRAIESFTRRITFLAMSIAVALIGTALTPSRATAQPFETADGGVLQLSISPGASSFVVGQPFELKFMVRNAGESGCQAPMIADGSLTITALERDGVPVFPVLATRYYSDDLSEAVREALSLLQPGATREYQLAQQSGTRTFLESINVAPSGRTGAALWPIDTPGAYRLTAAYGIRDAGATTCVGSSIATVDFRVVAASELLPLLLTALVLVMVIGAVAVLLLRRRRARAAVLAGLLPFALTISMVGPQNVLGVIEVAPGDSALTTLVGGCFAQFRAPGGDPAGVFRALESSGQKARIEPIAIGKPSTDSSDPSNSRRGTPTGSQIYVNPEYSGTFADGVGYDHCSSLYHEMSHALDFANGTDDSSGCGNSGIPIAEVKAVLIENQWRAAHNLPPRTRYGGRTFPSSVSECKKKQPGGPRRPGGKRGIECDVSDCGSSNGDPHLGTFDGRYFDFQAAGEFILTSSEDDAFQAQARQVPFPGSNHVSVNSALAFRVGDARVGFYADVGETASGLITVLVDGAAANVTTAIPLAGGGSLERDEDAILESYFLEWPDGSLAYVGNVGAWGVQTVIQPAEAHRGNLVGLLGNFDGDIRREFFNRDGSLVADSANFEQLHGTFAESWRVRDGESLFDYGPGESTANFAIADFPKAELGLDDIPDLDLIRAACEAEGLTVEELLRQCIIDLAVTGRWDFGEGAGSAQTALNGGGEFSRPPLPIATGSVPATGARARVVNLYTENGQPVDVDVYAYTWSQAAMSEVAALVATVPYGQASDWFSPGIAEAPFSEEPYTKVNVFRRGDTDELNALGGTSEFLGDPQTVASIVIWQEEVFQGEPDAWVEVIYAEHPTYNVSRAPAGQGLLMSRDVGLRAEGEAPFMNASIGDGCLESPIGRSDPDIPNVQPVNSDLVLPVGEHTLTVHEEPAGVLPTCETKPLGPGAPINVAAGDRLIAFPYRLPGAGETSLLVIPFDP